jgi:hypothetical protein
MSMCGQMLPEEQWSKTEPLILKRPENPKGGTPLAR